MSVIKLACIKSCRLNIFLKNAYIRNRVVCLTFTPLAGFPFEQSPSFSLGLASEMRAFVSFVLLSGMALALPLEKRAKNVVPSTCDPAVVNVVLDTLNSMSAPEIEMLATFETALVCLYLIQ
jgi:hypothetical protein